MEPLRGRVGMLEGVGHHLVQRESERHEPFFRHGPVRDGELKWHALLVDLIALPKMGDEAGGEGLEVRGSTSASSTSAPASSPPSTSRRAGPGTGGRFPGGS